MKCFIALSHVINYCKCHNANLDIDECLDRSHECQQICINLPGTFACTCEKGFSTDANEIECTDNDECALRSHNCHVNAGMNLIGFLLICSEAHNMGPI